MSRSCVTKLIQAKHKRTFIEMKGCCFSVMPVAFVKYLVFLSWKMVYLEGQDRQEKRGRRGTRNLQRS